MLSGTDKKVSHRITTRRVKVENAAKLYQCSDKQHVEGAEKQARRDVALMSNRFKEAFHRAKGVIAAKPKSPQLQLRQSFSLN